MGNLYQRVLSSGITRTVGLVAMALVVALTIALSPAYTVMAQSGSANQAIEYNGNADSGTHYSLTYVGWVNGCKQPGNYDHMFRINGNVNVNVDRLRMGSSWLISQKWFGHTFEGRNLTSASRYVCIGNSDFFAVTGALAIQNYAYVYVAK